MDLSKEFWEKAYMENAPKMKGVCRRYVSDTKVAEDLMHDAFLTAINKQDTFKGKGCFEGWLRRIALNTALMYLRTKDSEETNNERILYEIKDQHMEESNTNNIRGVIEQADFSDTELLEIIDQLPEHHKRVFNLYVIDNFTHAQVGKELNISTGTSKSHLARARKRIQQLLYQKAIDNTKEHKKSKRAGMFLFFLPWKSHYIDVLFKNSLADFSIGIIGKPSTLLDSVKWTKVNLSITQPGFWTTAVNSWVVAATGGVIITSCVIYNHIYSSNVAPKINSMELNNPIELFEAKDSTYIEPVKDTVRESEISENENISSTPVIVRRKIIQRKTVIIRDTIKILDSSYVH